MPYKNYADAVANARKHAPAYNARRRADRKQRPEVYAHWEQTKRMKYRKRIIVRKAKARAEKENLEWGLGDPEDAAQRLQWPTHCPVFETELDYSIGRGSQPNNPSLDRFDPRKGYTWDNVVVISYRANTLKSNAIPEELEALAHYAMHFVPDRNWQEASPALSRKVAEVLKPKTPLEHFLAIRTPA